jgi:uncharacterized protein (DUF1778 family)
MSAIRQTKPYRLAARVSPEQRELIQRAASLEGRTVTDYVVASAEASARETIRAHEVLRLSLEGAKQFFEAIEHPAPPNERLLSTAERYRKLVSY